MSSDTKDRPAISTGSLFKSSEGVLVTALSGFTGFIVQGDFSDPVRITAIITLGVVISVYALARTLIKS